MISPLEREQLAQLRGLLPRDSVIASKEALVELSGRPANHADELAFYKRLARVGRLEQLRACRPAEMRELARQYGSRS